MSGQWDRSASSSWGRQGRGSGLDSWLGLATQMMVLPFRMLGWGTQLLTGTGQGIQRLGDRGGGGRGDCGCGGQGSRSNRGDWTGTGAQDWRPAAVEPQAVPPPPAWQAPAYPPPAPPQNSSTGGDNPAGAVPNPVKTTQREEKDMACDTDLSGTDLKIIEYTIVSVDPNIQNDNRRIIQPMRTIATTEDMNENGFIAWVIALYFQGPHKPMTSSQKQYLRVCYCVQCRMPIPEEDCCQTQNNRLRDINRTLERLVLAEGGTLERDEDTDDVAGHAGTTSLVTTGGQGGQGAQGNQGDQGNQGKQG